MRSPPKLIDGRTQPHEDHREAPQVESRWEFSSISNKSFSLDFVGDCHVASREHVGWLPRRGVEAGLPPASSQTNLRFNILVSWRTLATKQARLTTCMVWGPSSFPSRLELDGHEAIHQNLNSNLNARSGEFSWEPETSTRGVIKLKLTKIHTSLWPRVKWSSGIACRARRTQAAGVTRTTNIWTRNFKTFSTHPHLLILCQTVAQE